MAPTPWTSSFHPRPRAEAAQRLFAPVTVVAPSHLVRSQDPGQRRVLDRAARQRRINRQLEALENDNFQDDPHAGLPQLGKRLPQFDDDADTGEAGGGGRGCRGGQWKGGSRRQGCRKREEPGWVRAV